MPTEIGDAIELLKKRAKEFAYLHLLLYILEANIDVRRALEGIQRVPFEGKQSVQVEHSREAVQEQAQQVEAEMHSMVELLLKMARNEAAK